MADDEGSSSDSKKSDSSFWLSVLGVAGAIGGLAYLASEAGKQDKRNVRELAESLVRLSSEQQAKNQESLNNLVASASEKIEAKIEERVERRLDAADTRFNRRIDQISDSGASAVEQSLREINRRSEEMLSKAASGLEHIGWLGDEVAPAAGDSRESETTDDDPVWTELGDFQSQFES